MSALCVPNPLSRTLSAVIAFVLAASVVLVAPAVSPGIPPNDNILMALAAPTSEPITYQSMVGPDAIHRVYYVDLQAGDTLVVAGGLQGDIPGASSEARVFGPTATDVTVDVPVAEAAEGTSTVQYTAPATGRHYIDIMSSWAMAIAYGWMVMVVPGDAPGQIEPVVTFEPDLVSFEAAPGGLPPASQTVTITIGGFESPVVDWYLFDIPEWLSIAPATGRAPGVNVMQIAVDTSKLEPGASYEASVQVAVEIPSAPTGFASIAGLPGGFSKIARMPDSYGTLPVSLDFRVPSAIDDVMVSPAAPKRTSTATPKTTVSGRLVAQGSVDTATVLANQVVDIKASSDGVNYSRVATAATDATGGFSCQVPVARKTYLMAVFAGNDVLAESPSEPKVCLPGAYLSKPAAPDRVARGRSFATYGYVYPKHTSTYPAKLAFYRYERLRSGRYDYVYKKTISAKRIETSSTRVRYKGVTSLGTAGKWCVRAVHSDSDHLKSYSAYEYFVVR